MTTRPAFAEATVGGHGEGRNETDDAFTLARRRFHHVTFYGFPAGLRHDRRRDVKSLRDRPSRIRLLVGPTGLLWLNLHRHPKHDDPAQRPLDRGFIAQLDSDRAGSSSVPSELPSIQLIRIKPPA